MKRRKDLLNAEDRQELIETLREIFAEFSPERFVVVAFTSDDHAVVLRTRMEGDENTDVKEDLRRVISGERQTSMTMEV